MALLEVKCPKCKCTLWIDPLNGRIADYKAADHKNIDLDDFLKKDKKRESELENMFTKAEKENEKRKKLLEDGFKNVKENPDQYKKGEFESPFDWD